MENKISIGEPFVNCYSKFAAITSIISVDDKAKIWGYLNYSTLMYMRSEANDLFWMDLRSDENTIWEPEWKLCPYIDGEQIETEKIINNGTFTRFVINNIDKGNCIYADICISSIHAYNTKRVRQHDLLIYGYDLKEQTAICRDYFSLKYEEQRIPFEELEKGFYGKYECEDRKDYNFIFKFHQSVNSYNPTFDEYRAYIKKMLKPTNFYSYEPGTEKSFQFLFGLEAYQYLFYDYDKEFLGLNDVRPLYVIKNHLQLLAELSDYFGLPFDELLKELHKLNETICNLAIKYKITKKEETKQKMIAFSNEFLAIEKDYFEKILMYKKGSVNEDSI